MGGFVSSCWNFVTWIGNSIIKIATWWDDFISRVNTNVVSFLETKKSRILDARKPREVGELVAIQKHTNELKWEYLKRRNNLCTYDKNLIDDILK